ncbi:hypothetical protein HCJ66_11145 [Listeria sp. FSL L7-1582]|uniref:hypothetical protein n=1 Tax=Listeria portnoyi TaxID=2713504 RepID=UPI00164E39AA|nr:hypothetical protein [Listeria portnoyi]MBC6310093.1 hypothetical protein [Listeria portnoyi]
MKKTLVVANTGLNFIVYINELLKDSKSEIDRAVFEENVVALWDEILASSLHFDAGFKQYIAIQGANLTTIAMRLLGRERTEVIRDFDSWWEKSGDYGMIHEVESSLNEEIVLECKEKFIYVLFSDAPKGCKLSYKDLIRIIAKKI